MGKKETYHDWWEARRYRAYELQAQGWTGRAIAKALGVTPGAVSQWLTKAREGGKEALRHIPVRGRPRKLTSAQRAELPQLLARGASAYGLQSAIWTSQRIADLVFQYFGVEYSQRHICQLLKEAGWSQQKPITRATQRDEQAIVQWQEEEWPRIKKSPRGGANSPVGR